MKNWSSHLFHGQVECEQTSARRIGISRKTKTKEFDQAESELGSTVFDNNKRDSILIVSLPRIKAGEDMEKRFNEEF